MAGIRRRPELIPVGRLAMMLLAGAMLMGCGEDPMSSTVGAPPSVSPIGPEYVPPPVSVPLDATEFIADPCGLLSVGEAEELGLPVSATKELGGQLSCEWRGQQAKPVALDKLRVQFMSGYGLRAIHRQCEGPRNEQCRTWSAATVAGYPAILANGPLESKHGLCKLFVGLADDLSLLVADTEVAGGESAGPDCGRSEQVAAMAVDRMRESG